MQMIKTRRRAARLTETIRLVTMPRALCMTLIVSVMLATATASTIESAWRTEEQNKNQRDPKLLFGLLGGSRCPTPFPICPRDCSIDPAVVHGFCCGCGGPFDFAPVHCPDWLQCPLRPEPLCSDYRFVMDCCCGRPFLPFL